MEATMQLSSVGLLKQPQKQELPSIEILTKQYLYDMENVYEASIETVKSRRSYLRDFSEYFNEFEVNEITNTHLNEYFTYLKNRVSPLTGRPISYGSLNNRKRALRVFFRWLIEDREVSVKVIPARIVIKREPDGHTKQIAHEDILYVIDRVTHRQDQLMIRLAYEAGLRISELVKVKVDHLNGRKLEVVGKGSKRRNTFISHELADDLRKWMEDKSWHMGYVFRPNLHGKAGECYRHVDSIRQRIKRWFKKLLGLKMHPHQLRHAFARRLLEAGVSLRAIQKLLGHAGVETTMTYLGVDDAWLEKEYMRAVHHNNLKR
jgi:integrase/recombinase XerD